MDSVQAYKSTCIVPLEVLDSNRSSAVKRGLPVLIHGNPHDIKAAVVAGGPSVQNHLKELKEFEGYIVAINGMHDYLVDNGIIPDACILVDPQPSMVDLFQKPNDFTTYLVASNCCPELFDALEGKRVILWHAARENKLEGSLSILTGPSAVTSSPYLLYMIGYRDVHLYGVDGSISGVNSHVYSNGNAGEKRMQAMVGEDVFLTTGQYIAQAQHLWDLNKILLKDLKMTVHGSGLTKAVFENNGKFEVI